jgi:hypothetical protein
LFEGDISMKNRKWLPGVIVFLSLAFAVSLSLKSYLLEREQAKIERELFPVIVEKNGCKPDFVVNSETSLILYCEKTDATDKEFIRNATLAVLKSWAETTKYQEKSLGVSFVDEVAFPIKK